MADFCIEVRYHRGVGSIVSDFVTVEAYNLTAAIDQVRKSFEERGYMVLGAARAF
jgi:hypothetical protein